MEPANTTPIMGKTAKLFNVGPLWKKERKGVCIFQVAYPWGVEKGG